MAKKSKTFRGNWHKRIKRLCDCFFCVGTDRDEFIKLKTKHLDKEIKELK